MAKLRSLATGAAFLLFLAGAVGTSFLSFQRKVLTFSDVGVETAIGRGEIRVLAVDPHAETDLRPGDRIVLLDGVPISALPQPTRSLSHPPFPHRLAVVRNNAVLPAVVGGVRIRLDLPYLFLVFVGLLYLLIGLATLARERSPSTWLFASFCVAAFAIQAITPSGPLDPTWKLLWLTEDFFRALAPALLLHFFLVFPVRSKRPLWPLYLAPALYLGAELALSLPGLRLDPSKTAFLVELVERFWILYFAAYAAAAIVRILSFARSAADPGIRQQSRWISVGVTFGLLPFLVLYAVPRLFGYTSDWAACAGIVPLVFVPLGFAYAILRWRLWDVDIIAREIAAATVAVFLGAVSFALLNLLLTKTLAAFGSGAKNLVAYGSGVLIASMLVPVKRRLSDAIERFQYGESYRARRALLDFARQWKEARDPGEFARSLARGVAEALDLVPCRVYLFEQPLPGGLTRTALEEKFAAGDFARVRSSTFPSGEDLAFLHLHQDGFRYLFALRSGGSLAGFLAAGLKDNGIPLSSEDTALLQTVMSQASLAYENAELYRTLARRVDEIRTLQEFQDGVIRSSSAGIAVVDSNRRLVSANPAFERIAGRSEADLRGLPLADVLPSALPALEAGPAEAGTEISVPAPSGEDRIYRISASPLSGSATSRVLLVDDVTDRVALERHLSEKERLASLGVLAAGVAHEVNTPLAGISSYAQMLLAEMEPSDPHYSILKKMERQTFRASRLVRDLLEFARGRKGGAPAPMDLARTLLDSVESCESALAAASIRIETAGLDGQLPMNGFPREVEQVFVNLIINARDASPAGSAIEIRAESTDGGYRVRVEDRGKGLTDEEARRAFEPFFTTRHAGGTGLGLAIAREIVERHGGSISLAARPGGGATATVVLPRG